MDVPAELVECAIHWSIDSTREFWLTAAVSGMGTLYIRMSRFPDEPLYSLLLKDGLFVDFDDFPTRWTRDPLIWPPTAAPRWPRTRGMS